MSIWALVDDPGLGLEDHRSRLTAKRANFPHYLWHGAFLDPSSYAWRTLAGASNTRHFLLCEFAYDDAEGDRLPITQDFQGHFFVHRSARHQTG